MSEVSQNRLLRMLINTGTVVVAASLFYVAARASCETVRSGVRAAFDGKSLVGLSVEKKSLIILHKAFPNLNVIERTFKGEILTCTGCVENYVTCHE